MFNATLLIIIAVSVHLVNTPPNAPAAKKERIDLQNLFDKTVRGVAFCMKSMVWLVAICAILASYAATESSIRHVVGPYPCPAIQTMQPGLLAGAAMSLTGSVVRLWSYRTMGSLYTFEVSIRHQHKLVTTGPYAYVRHPGYISGYMTFIGASLGLFWRGAWLMECGVMNRGGVFLSAIWYIKCGWIFVNSYKRIVKEDRELGKMFGRAWEEYAQRVPYTLVPGVI